MAQTLFSVVVLVVLLALAPLALRWLQKRNLAGFSSSACSARVVSAVAVGPHQRVVTVEIGPDGERLWLTLGVTAQAISCLHSAPAPQNATTVPAPVVLPK